MKTAKTAYKVNQKIVYPSQGVGKITEIKEKTFREQTLLYYVIYIEVTDMVIMVPVEKCDELGIRAIVSPEEALQAIDVLGENFEPITSDWKLRYQMNLDLLKSGSVNDIAKVVRCLYHRSKIKELPIMERKLYDSAKKLLEDELSFSLDKPMSEIEAMIHAKLEPFGVVYSKSQSTSKVFDDDDDDDFIDDSNDSENDDFDDDGDKD
ncbi:MAG: CarD family transcriptional regulator [Treponema sp.]|nr:CarD family transcriptional regulator [Treponema sp.]